MKDPALDSENNLLHSLLDLHSKHGSSSESLVTLLNASIEQQQAQFRSLTQTDMNESKSKHKEISYDDEFNVKNKQDLESEQENTPSKKKKKRKDVDRVNLSEGELQTSTLNDSATPKKHKKRKHTHLSVSEIEEDTPGNTPRKSKKKKHKDAESAGMTMSDKLPSPILVNLDSLLKKYKKRRHEDYDSSEVDDVNETPAKEDSEYGLKKKTKKKHKRTSIDESEGHVDGTKKQKNHERLELEDIADEFKKPKKHRKSDTLALSHVHSYLSENIMPHNSPKTSGADASESEGHAEESNVHKRHNNLNSFSSISETDSFGKKHKQKKHKKSHSKDISENNGSIPRTDEETGNIDSLENEEIRHETREVVDSENVAHHNSHKTYGADESNASESAKENNVHKRHKNLNSLSSISEVDSFSKKRKQKKHKRLHSNDISENDGSIPRTYEETGNTNSLENEDIRIQEIHEEVDSENVTQHNIHKTSGARDSNALESEGLAEESNVHKLHKNLNFSISETDNFGKKHKQKKHKKSHSKDISKNDGSKPKSHDETGNTNSLENEENTSQRKSQINLSTLEKMKSKHKKYYLPSNSMENTENTESPAGDKSKVIDFINEALDSTENKSLNEEDMSLLTNLYICVPWEIPPSHTIETRLSHPTSDQYKEFKDLDYPMKSGPYTKEEDQAIKNNWEEFCRDHDLKISPLVFFPVEGENKNVLPPSQRIKFVRYLGKGLQHRMLCSIYSRFQLLFRPYKKGRFTPEEDNVILTFVENSNVSNKYSVLASILQRGRELIKKRHQVLKLDDEKVSWNMPLLQDLVNNLLEVTEKQNVEELKEFYIEPDHWKKIEIKMNIQASKIKKKWLLYLYPRLFIEEYHTLNDIREKLIDILYQSQETDRKEINWTELAQNFDGMTSVRLYKIFLDMLAQYVSKEDQSNLRDTIISLKRTLPHMLRKEKPLSKFMHNNGQLFNTNVFEPVITF